jgi:t-SNARE complex subunit (syntaxin)
MEYDFEPAPEDKDRIENIDEADAGFLKRSREKTLVYFSVMLLAIVVIVIILFKVISNKSPYEEGVIYLRNRQYDAAFAEFQRVKTEDKNYFLSVSKINFIKGARLYESSQYDDAKIYLSSVLPNDEFKAESDVMLSKIEAYEIANKKFLDEKKQREKLQAELIAKRREESLKAVKDSIEKLDTINYIYK